MRALIDKKTAVERAKESACNPFGAALIVRQLEDMPEVKRSVQITCRDCGRNNSTECPFDNNVLNFRDDDKFYCSLAKRKSV
jgi:hypothetical protein